MLTVDLRRAGITARSRVLDVGCGGGRHAYACARTGADVVALDTNTGELREVAGLLGAMEEAGEIPAPARAGAVGADALALPFADRCFSHVIASEILEHVPDDAAALRELGRVLRPGGVLAVTVPRFWTETVNWALSSEYHNTPGGHIRIYTRGQLRTRLAAAGFAVEAIDHVHALHTPYWWLRCLVGVSRADQRLVAAYHRLLVHDIVHHPRWLHALERSLDPVLGKSIVLYCRATGAPARAVRAPAPPVDAVGAR